MNITLSQKHIRNSLLGILLLLIIGVGGYIAWRNRPQTPKFGEPTADEPALLAAAVIYSPDSAVAQEAWENQVCSGMTAKGCSVFKVMVAPTAWKKATAQKAPATATYLSTAEILKDGSQIWKVSVAATDMYVHVAVDPESGRWFLNRILFSEEAAKYAQP